jgi:predicted transcriptional regulator
LNRLVSELDIDLYQERLEEKLDDILLERDVPLSKEDVKHEIKSNHVMTNKVLKKLEEDGFVTLTQKGRRYEIRITKEGILHVRQFNEFYKRIYHEQILDHCKYREIPAWAR